ncbi:hypothetical protein Plhal304r1_c028g0092731 [Plasmopara halstedii]
MVRKLPSQISPPRIQRLAVPVGVFATPHALSALIIKTVEPAYRILRSQRV